MSNMPDGCSQADHDRAFDAPTKDNAVEIFDIKAKIKALEVPFFNMGFCVGYKSLTKIFGEELSPKALIAVQQSLVNAPISEEAQQWLEDACANLEEFARYAIRLEAELYQRLSELEDVND